MRQRDHTILALNRAGQRHVSSPRSGASSNRSLRPYGTMHTLLSMRAAKRPVLLVKCSSLKWRTITIWILDRIRVSSEHKHSSSRRKQRGHRPLRSRGVRDRTVRLLTSAGAAVYATTERGLVGQVQFLHTERARQGFQARSPLTPRVLRCVTRPALAAPPRLECGRPA